MRELPTGTVTLLFTDIEASTRLLRELGDGYAERLAEHRRLVREAVGAHGGVEVDTQGDAFFVAFQEAAAAVAAACEAQAALEGGPVRVRMGVHTGTPALAEEGYVGEDVHLAARIAAAAHGGQVVLSQATKALVDGLDVSDLGEHRLKDFAEPVWLFQLGDGVFPPLRTVANTNLPRPTSSFIGREGEVEELVELIHAGRRLVTITGPGGSGKTRLAIEAASELVGGFKAGVFWVGLAAVSNPQLVVPAVAEALGARDGLAAYVGERELLLVLDNLEQVVAAAPELAALVEACPNLVLLVTSRELLRVRGELAYEVPPLADADAVALFCERSRLPPAPSVAELSRRLDNMPLALELAAARTKALAPEQILERLSQRLDLLKGGRDADPRQQTLRATIEWSYDLLSPDEQALFRRLAVFVGGCTLEAAEEVCDADVDTLQSLVEKSLLRHTVDRFWMLETIREYALERLEESGEAEAIRGLQAEFFVELARTANLTAEAESGRRHDLVLPERGNLRAAIAWCIAADAIELGLELAVALENFWATDNALEGMRTLAALLDAAEDVPPDLRARALRCYGGTSQLSGAREQAQKAFEASLALFEMLGDDRGVAILRFRIANLAVSRERPDVAGRLLEECLESFQRIGSRRGEAQALGALGRVARTRGDVEGAAELLAQSAAMVAELGFPWWEAGMLLELAKCFLDLRRVDDAAEAARKAVVIARAIEDRVDVLHGLALLAIAAAESDLYLAGRLWGAVEAEERRGQLVGWDAQREGYAERIASEEADFERGRAEGSRLSLAEAVESALRDA